MPSSKPHQRAQNDRTSRLHLSLSIGWAEWKPLHNQCKIIVNQSIEAREREGERPEAEVMIECRSETEVLTKRGSRERQARTNQFADWKKHPPLITQRSSVLRLKAISNTTETSHRSSVARKNCPAPFFPVPVLAIKSYLPGKVYSPNLIYFLLAALAIGPSSSSDVYPIFLLLLYYFTLNKKSL